jgi:hypothetical protein
VTFADWVMASRERFRTQPTGTAAKQSLMSFGIGAFRRLQTHGGLQVGTPIFERDDWGVCLVLDACRVDAFEEVARETEWLDDSQLTSIRSAGSMSAEWMDETFHDGYARERARTMYVTGNPFSGKDPATPGVPELRNGALPLQSDDFALLEEVWRTDWVDGMGVSMPPEALTDRAVAAWRRREEFGADRMVVHYMQPHIPFRSRPEWFHGRDADAFGHGNDVGQKDHWHQVRDGDLPREEFWEAYLDNLRWVLEHVRTCAENMNARIAVTSDHGNGMGEGGVWSHPPGCLVPAVRRVPWLVVDGADEETHTPEVTLGETRGVAEDDINERLAALGYAEGEH